MDFCKIDPYIVWVEAKTNRLTNNNPLRISDCFLIILPVIALLWPSLDIKFVSDNISHITSAWQDITNLDFQYYRPLTVFTLAMDNAIWGLEPVGFHLTNLLFHLAATLLVYLFAGRITQLRAAAIVASILYGLHPIHSMSIFWISGRVDILCTIFYLGSFICFIDFTGSRRTSHLILSLVLFAGAIGAKEMALSLPLTIAAYLMIFSRDKSYFALKRSLMVVLPYAVIALAYIIFKFSIVGTEAFENSVHLNTNPIHLLKNISIFGGFLILPGWHLELGTYLRSHQTVFIILSVISISALLFSLRWIVRSKQALFGILFIVLALLPVMRLAMRWYLYLPSVGFCLLIGYFAGSLWAKKQYRALVVAATVLITVTYGIFLAADQSRWLAAGRMASSLSSEVASVMADQGLSTSYLLTVPAELEQTPVLMYGLNSNVNAEYDKLNDTAGDVTVIPVLHLSLSSEEDFSKCLIMDAKNGTYDISLEGTLSSFVFPYETEIISGSHVIQEGDTIIREDFTLTITHINISGEADHVTVSLNDDRPVLFLNLGIIQIASGFSLQPQIKSSPQLNIN